MPSPPGFPGWHFAGRVELQVSSPFAHRRPEGRSRIDWWTLRDRLRAYEREGSSPPANPAPIWSFLMRTAAFPVLQLGIV